jgi:hypothetical protein
MLGIMKYAIYTIAIVLALIASLGTYYYINIPDINSLRNKIHIGDSIDSVYTDVSGIIDREGMISYSPGAIIASKHWTIGLYDRNSLYYYHMRCRFDKDIGNMEAKLISVSFDKQIKINDEYGGVFWLRCW